MGTVGEKPVERAGPESTGLACLKKNNHLVNPSCFIVILQNSWWFCHLLGITFCNYTVRDCIK